MNLGLPHCIAMDWKLKPEHGCEIQNACDGVCGVVMRLKLVKSAENAKRISLTPPKSSISFAKLKVFAFTSTFKLPILSLSGPNKER